MHGTTSLAGEIKEPKKNIPRSLFLGFDCHRYLYPGKFSLSGSFTHAWHPGASDIAGNGIMFASNDRGAAAAGMMGNSSVFIMAGLIMVSTLDVIVA
jgi:APA family basic amino acid/polyamine antiporter